MSAKFLDCVSIFLHSRQFHRRAVEERNQAGDEEMAVISSESTAQAVASLRALTYRLTSCPPKQLPHIAPQIAASLWSCKSVLSVPSDGAKASSDISQTASRFRASLSQLLQARSVEERWAAVVLAKAAVEAGGLDAVSKATGWAKSLTAILKKNDPPTTKMLAIVTLTRIFTLTWDDTNVVREITTPALPGFLQACLAASEKAAASSKLVQTVLEAFATLVPRHPTVFRTYEGQIRVMLLKLLSTTCSTETNERVPHRSCQDAAGRLLVLLHHCAPKQGGPEKYDETLKATVTAAHTSCDRLFRSINESWKSNAAIERVAKASSGELQLTGPDALGLTAWHGLHAGLERLTILVQLLQAHFEVMTSSTTALRVGMVVDLVKRLLELNASLRDQTAHFNAEISRDERESLFRAMPDVHVAALSLLETMVARLNRMMISAIPDTIEALAALFAAESADENLRQTSYHLIGTTLKLVGPTFSNDIVADLSSIIRGCCDDLLSSSSTGKDRAASGDVGDSRPLPHARTSSDVHDAAWNLLPLLFAKVDQSALPAKLRTKMEHVAVLTRHKKALVASVLNPPRKSRDTALRPSLLPLLAREFPDCQEVEALLRPRYPVAGAKARGQSEDGMILGEEEESSEDGDDEMDDTITHQGVNGQDADLPADSSPAEDRTNPAGPHHTSAINSSPIEVFSTAPEQASEADDSQQSSKRPAPDSSSLYESETKRPRPSRLVAAQPGDESQRVETTMPSGGGADGSVEAQSAAEVTSDMKMPLGAVEGEADDSDFEIPPLTMDSDSDPDEAA